MHPDRLSAGLGIQSKPNRAASRLLKECQRTLLKAALVMVKVFEVYDLKTAIRFFNAAKF